MNTDTIQGNKLIAQFMGWEHVTVGYFGEEDETEWQRQNEDWMDRVGMDSIGDYYVNIPENRFFTSDSLRYHYSWDELMPVVEKIESLQYDSGFGPVNFPVHISTDKVVIGEHYYYDFADITKDQPKIVATWLTVVDFIQWYNEQKSNDISPHSEQ